MQKDFDVEVALSTAEPLMTRFDLRMLQEIVHEWYNSPTLSGCIAKWKSLQKESLHSTPSPLQILLFNVRGLDTRLGEVILLIEKYKADCIVLTETGMLEISDMQQVFCNYKLFYQKGENSWGGVLMLFKKNLPTIKIHCATPNICIVDLNVENPIRIIGIYGTRSRSWGWEVLSQYISNSCCILGDFNIDPSDPADTKHTTELFEWADSYSLAPVIPNSPTSFRSNRTIDYAFTNSPSLALQTCNDSTTSDHKPLIGSLEGIIKENSLGSNTHWTVFSFFLSIVIEFWKKEGQGTNTDEYYTNFINFLDSLRVRCTTYYTLNKYRMAIPPELRAKLAYTRALSFRHKRTGDVRLHLRVKELRRANRLELLALRTDKLKIATKERNSSPSAPSLFWATAQKKLQNHNPTRWAN